MQRLSVEPGTRVDLTAVDPAATPGFHGDKEAALPVFQAARQRLGELQDMLYAEGRRRLLIVLQARDTGGKDGTIRHVFGLVDPIGVRVVPFKVPTEAERSHDFLWRVHPHVPGDGEVVIFNRSHYEDVLVTRVHGLVDDGRARRRLEHIRHFERLLTDEGTTIVKFFLHISADEQKARLQARLDDPAKHWKFSAGDLVERAKWDEYRRAYEDVLSETSTAEAPWYVIPADRKWYRNLAVARILVDVLERLDLRYPAPADDLTGVVIE